MPIKIRPIQSQLKIQPIEPISYNPVEEKKEPVFKSHIQKAKRLEQKKTVISQK